MEMGLESYIRRNRKAIPPMFDESVSLTMPITIRVQPVCTLAVTS
jgi:hypothetical protein